MRRPLPKLEDAAANLGTLHENMRSQAMGLIEDRRYFMEKHHPNTQDSANAVTKRGRRKRVVKERVLGEARWTNQLGIHQS